MGQKIHPLGFRLGITQDHRSHWFAKPAQYRQLLQEDNSIRNFLRTKLINAGIARIDIQRKADQVEIEVRTARPGLIVGRSGKGVENLLRDLQEQFKNKRRFRITITYIPEPDLESTLIAEFIAQRLEARAPFRRAMRQAIQRATRAGVEGIKIQVAGRLNGAEIARSEWVREGRVPLQTLRANIDYSYCQAKTIYGILGIKVWMFKGEKFSSKAVTT
uniref:Small ribosomal subunit protein uS3c n=1 Tax=Chlorokybus atmophyticus TaxID=3144 RepID=RR3_CHLAT|nr:ribosomal protein S3 [Chlorokybus atmophyticus]Q19VB0.2 RecName: Full=Small ribosomal subunit protein uS3c; AltName: Full=30S ribosomal protein S3, chloroplastic [Chlorokybus atmophyticus]ABD62251.2 ribosomal protein S3 [Chlorokybus atmophyticus]WKT05637.1 ribosomal protein S3 [Chlorokybus atmophyticus]